MCPSNISGLKKYHKRFYQNIQKCWARDTTWLNISGYFGKIFCAIFSVQKPYWGTCRKQITHPKSSVLVLRLDSHIHGTSLEPLWNLPGTSLWNLPGTSLEPPWNLPGTSLWNLSGTSLEPLSGTSLEPLWNLSGTSLEPLWKVLSLGTKPRY